MKKSNSNLFTRSAYGLFFLLIFPVIPIVLGMLFDERMDFKPSVFYWFIPSFVYLLYAHYVVRNYYKQKLHKSIAALENITIRVDEMISKEVEYTTFNYLGLGSNVSEYFVTIYNKQYDKYFRLSSVGNRPNYADIYIPEWEGKEISIYIDPKELENPQKGKSTKKNKHTLWVFRFMVDIYDLEDNYAYSMSEDIARRNFLEGCLLLFLFLFLCLYALISIM